MSGASSIRINNFDLNPVVVFGTDKPTVHAAVNKRSSSILMMAMYHTTVPASHATLNCQWMYHPGVCTVLGHNL